MQDSGARIRDDGATSGPVGRVLRVAAGVLLLGSIAAFYRDGSPGFALRSVGVAFGLAIVYILLSRLFSNRSSGVASGLGACFALVPLILVAALGVGGGPIFGAGEGQLGALTFLGVSLVLAGLRADSGCEVMAIPNGISRERTHLACLLFSPIDRLERQWSRARRAR